MQTPADMSYKVSSLFFCKYPAMDIVRYYRSAMAQKLFSTGPGIFRRAERKETTNGLDQTSCDGLFHYEWFWGIE